MIAASIWSLITPAIEMSSDMSLPWLPAAIGFLLGVGFLLLLDTLIPHMHLNSEEVEGLQGKKKLKKSTMLVFAVTLHNIPEGMAVGVVLAGAGNTMLSMTAALALSIGIALQNLPEGAIISMPLIGEGYTKPKAFMLGTLSGIVEPIAAIITILLIGVIEPILPYLLAFAAGAMIYVVVEELIPEAQEGKHSNLATIALSLGFVLMMILDIALS
jgi:ZIP family zinc transporter